MKPSLEQQKEIGQAIAVGDIAYLKSLHEDGVNLRYANDYYLYLSAFYMQENISKFLIEIDLDPELVKSRLENNKKALEKIRLLKKEKEIKALYEEVKDMVSVKDKEEKKKKI